MEFTGNVAVSHDVKIVGLADAVEGRVSIVINNGQVYQHERKTILFTFCRSLSCKLTMGIADNCAGWILATLR